VQGQALPQPIPSPDHAFTFESLRDLFPEAQFLNMQPRPLGQCRCDSRQVKPGDLFVAVRGVDVDGHQYVPQALIKGAAALIVEHAQPNGLPQCIVADSRRAYALLCHARAGYPADRMTSVGVTGTNGKTTTCYLIRSILKAAGLHPGLLGTVQYSIGTVSIDSNMTTPDSAELVDMLEQMAGHGATHLVMEVSSHGLDQRRTDGIGFKVAVFTNLTGDHLDYHKTHAQYRDAKGRLFRALDPDSVAVINADDATAQQFIDETSAEVLTYALEADAKVQAAISELTVRGCKFELRTPVGRVPVATSLAGRHNVANCLAAAAVGIALGIDLETIKRGIEVVKGVPGRLESVDNGQPFSVLVDYAHTDDALHNVLKGLRQLVDGRLLVVFGAGGDRDRTKRPRMAQAVAKFADKAWVTNDNPRTEDPERIASEIIAGAGRKLKRFRKQLDRCEAITEAIREAEAGDCVLIAGKGHETTQTVGTEKFPFDDRHVAAEVLEQMATVEACLPSRPEDSRDAALPRGLFVEEAARAIGARLVGAPVNGQMIRRIATDSRAMAPGALFWAIKGEKFNGHAYIEAALEAGAAGVVVSQLADVEPLQRRGAYALFVEDTVKALGDLAHYYRSQQRAQVVAVTGSVGKTTTKEMIYTLLSSRMRGIRSLKSFNNPIGLPLTIFGIGPHDDFAVLEMGTDAPGQIARLTDIAAPDVGVLTAIGEAHLKGLGSIEGVASAKAEMLEHLQRGATAVLNVDDPWIAQMKGEAPDKPILVGTAGEVHLRADRIETTGGGVSFRVNGRFRVRLPMPGRHNVTNALLAIGAARRLGLPMEAVVEAFDNMVGLPMRCQVEHIGAIAIINDAYNANPCSMAAGLDVLCDYEPATRRIFVCGDMLDLGDASHQRHADLGREVARRPIDLCFAVGEAGRGVADAIQNENTRCRARHFSTCEEAAKMVGPMLVAGDAMLVKGSRAIGLERFLDLIRQHLARRRTRKI